MPYLALGLLISALNGMAGHLLALPLRTGEMLYFLAGILLVIGSIVVLFGEV